MVGGGTPKKTGINWPATGIAIQILMVIIAGLMGYAYINGGTSSRIDRIEQDMRDKATKQEVTALRQYVDDNRARRDQQIAEIVARRRR